MRKQTPFQFAKSQRQARAQEEKYRRRQQRRLEKRQRRARGLSPEK